MAISGAEQAPASAGYWEWPQWETFTEQRQFGHHGKEGALRGIRSTVWARGTWDWQLGQASREDSWRVAAGRGAKSRKGDPAVPTATKSWDGWLGSQAEDEQGGKARTGKREVRVRKEQNRTGHLKHKLPLHVSPLLFSHSYTIAESRSTCQCWIITYFTSHKLRQIWPKLKSPLWQV